MFPDLEDMLVALGVITCFLVSVSMVALLPRMKRVWRAVLILLAIFLLSDGIEHVARAWFHDLPRGTNFYRVFLATIAIYGVYAYIARPTDPPEHG